MKFCKDCEHFHIIQQPIKPHYDTGLAECRKHNMVVDFYDMRKFEKLSCVEEGSENENNNV